MNLAFRKHLIQRGSTESSNSYLHTRLHTPLVFNPYFNDVELKFNLISLYFYQPHCKASAVNKVIREAVLRDKIKYTRRAIQFTLEAFF